MSNQQKISGSQLSSTKLLVQNGNESNWRQKMGNSFFRDSLKKILLPAAVLSGILAQTSAVFAEDSKKPGIVWSAEFDSDAGLKDASVYCEEFASHGKFPEFLIKEINNGICRYGFKSDARKRLAKGSVFMVWGDTLWWPTVGAWGPFDVKQCVLEISWRGTPFNLYYGYVDPSGKKQAAYRWVTAFKTVDKTDPTGNWHVSTLNFSEISDAVSLIGINLSIAVDDGTADVVTELSYIRLVAVPKK